LGGLVAGEGVVNVGRLVGGKDDVMAVINYNNH